MDNIEKTECKNDCATCCKNATIYSMMNYIGLTVLKGTVGYYAGSKALMADALHSGSDIISAIFGTIGVRISKKSPDRKHPYGHGKIEFVIGMLVGAGILYAAFHIIYAAAKILWLGQHAQAPHIISIIVPMIAIYANVIVSHLTICAADHSKSPVLKAISHNTRSDIYSSSFLIIALIGTQLGYTFLDPFGGVIVGCILLKVSGSIMLENYKGLMDAATDDSTIKNIKETISLVADLKTVKYIRTRRTGAKVWVDVGIFVGKDKTIEESGMISDAINNAILHKMPDIIDTVQISVSPLPTV